MGTNDLVRNEPEEVANSMDIMINKVKNGAKEIAVSGVIRRNDGRIPNSKIDKYNNLLHDLSYKHKITFINNDCIDESSLNGSRLHLNRMGDRASSLRKCILYFPKIKQNEKHRHGFKPSWQPFFSTNPWSPARLDNVPEPCETNVETEATLDLDDNVSSNFMRTLSSIPNERGFKMAFLNIVSLPERIDEIKFSMTNKQIDLIAFNERRLDANITNNMINLDGFPVKCHTFANNWH